MKKMKMASVLTACAMLMGTAVVMPEFPEMMSISASAEYTEGTYGVLTYQNYGDHIVISGCDETATEVEIPSEIDGVPVTTIGAYAFYGCSQLKRVSIQEGVITIGDSVFSECSRLTDVVLPEGVTEIGSNAFSYCVSLKEIQLPEGLTTIGNSAFKWCLSMESIAIPEGITMLGYQTFDSCIRLKTVSLPATLTAQVDPMGGEVTAISSAFTHCAGLLDVYYDGTEEEWESLNVIDRCLANLPGLRFKGSEVGQLPEVSVELPDLAYALEENNDQIFMRLTPPEKRVYQVGEAYEWGTGNTSGTYDGEAPISRGCAMVRMPLSESNTDISAFDSTKPGIYPIYVTYMDQTLYFLVEVVAAEQTEPTLPLADLNGDSTIDANDASMLLVAAANAGSGADSGLTAAQIAAADLNADGNFDASDASLILMYAAYAGAGGELDITGFLAQL